MLRLIRIPDDLYPLFCSLFMLRQAQHERGLPLGVGTWAVRPERVEGRALMDSHQGETVLHMLQLGPRL